MPHDGLMMGGVSVSAAGGDASLGDPNFMHFNWFPNDTGCTAFAAV